MLLPLETPAKAGNEKKKKWLIAGNSSNTLLKPCVLQALPLGPQRGGGEEKCYNTKSIR
jgi:hypothetical protein